MKKKISILIILVLIGIGIGISGKYYYDNYSKGVKDGKVVQLKKGGKIKDFIKEVGFEVTPLTKVYLRLNPNIKKAKAGYYTIKKGTSLNSIIDMVVEGRTKLIKITIPEGYTVDEIGDLLVRKKLTTKKAFYEVFKEVEFPYYTPNNNFEGYLYPETYYVGVGSNAKTVIKVMLGEFLKHYPVEKYGTTTPEKREFYKKLIMGSIIEKEAVVDRDKPLIASVFYNRIKRGMRLGSDATVNYIFGYKKRRIYYKDLKVDSPYNTYRNKGLTPTPIGNPGEKAIDAALNPAKTDFLFFVAKYDGSGEHKFTRTYREHINYQKRNKSQPK